MEKETKYLISLCNAYLKGENVVLREDINYRKLYNLSRAHNLSAVVFCVIKNSENFDKVETAVTEKFKKDFLDAVMRYDFQFAAVEEADRILSESGIYHIFFKGAEIKEYYPVPQSRVMGDVDILIKPEDRENAKEVLTKNGFDPVNTNGPVYDYEKNGVKLEVHTKIISGKVGESDAETGYKDAVCHGLNKTVSDVLEPNYHFAYLIAHLAHHFWFYGAGIKLILDLAVFQNHFDIDFERVFEILENVSLDKFAKVILSVCYKWFEIGKDFGESTEKTEEFLTAFGVFGNKNRNNSAVIERKELEEGKVASSFSTRLRLLFPSYEKMKNIPYISFIEGKPYLTPAAWAYRFYYNFRYRKDFVKNSTKNIGSDESKKEAEQELAYFKEIGL